MSNRIFGLAPMKELDSFAAEVEKQQKQVPYTVTSIGEGKEALLKWKAERAEIDKKLKEISDIKYQAAKDRAVKIVEEHSHIGMVNSTEVETAETDMLDGKSYTSLAEKAARKRHLRLIEEPSKEEKDAFIEYKLFKFLTSFLK